jgi:MATE family multidrug resistance protein
MPPTSGIYTELRATLALAGPIIAGLLGQILLQVVDSIMIGRVGAVPLAASAFAGNVFGVFFVVGIGLLAPVAVRVANALGAHRNQQCGEVLRHGLLVAAAVAVVAVSAQLALLDRLHWFRQPPEVTVAARPYLLLIAWSLVPTLLFQALKQFYEGLGRPMVPMVILLGGVALNVFLNWVLIYGNLGAPALGLVGAGWATLLSRLATLAVLIIHVAAAPDYRAFRPRRWTARPQGAILRDLFGLGLPVGGQHLFESGLFSAAAFLMGWLGTVPLAAHQVAISCAATAFMVPLGVSLALSVRVGHAVGAGERQRLRPVFLGGTLACALFMAATTLLFLVAGRWIAQGFIADEAVIALAAQLLVVAGIFQVFDGTQVAAMGALRGLADVRGPTVIAFAGYWLLALPLAWTLAFPLGFGAVGIWAGMAAGLAVCAGLLTARFWGKARA